MNLDRRQFLQGMGGGVAGSLIAGSTARAATAGGAGAANPDGSDSELDLNTGEVKSRDSDSESAGGQPRARTKNDLSIDCLQDQKK